jgi:hypothetical protein
MRLSAGMTGRALSGYRCGRGQAEGLAVLGGETAVAGADGVAMFDALRRRGSAEWHEPGN